MQGARVLHRCSRKPSIRSSYGNSIKSDERTTVVVGTRVYEGVTRELARHYRLLGPMRAPFAESLACLAASDRNRARVIVTGASMIITREAMTLLPRLGLIAYTGSGYDGVDLEAAHDLGVAVSNCVG